MHRRSTKGALGAATESAIAIAIESGIGKGTETGTETGSGIETGYLLLCQRAWEGALGFGRLRALTG